MCDVVDILLGDQCGSNQGGTKLKFHYANVGDFLALKKPAPNATGAAKSLITEDHTFKSQKAWKTIEIVKNSGGLTIAPGGENSGTKVMTLVFRVPSNNVNARILFNQANGISPFIFLSEDANMEDGSYDQIGTEKQYATILGQKVAGTNDGEGGMYEFTVTATQNDRLIYEGAVTLTPAT
ncbi:hypothetical protein SAMN05216327_101206 [Dyadobacter sp. SG02]|uniref:hypothetical protein n=1 Tax=Dyadobacter sp. SG02 TaxID=1855291 RepID=UPI0008C2C758|nr:hypothetical protein [Dyadobacter sp. SG02]SEI39539.1 hypothetical protein SAMN05216327_101206 [Dyadobacter sp. SG02]